MDTEAPVNEGDVIEVEIIGIGKKGDGIANVEGFTLVVPGAVEGNKVKVKVSKVLSSMGFAEIVD